MSAQDLEEKRAREFLAAEYERDGKTGSADHIRTQPLLPNKDRAVRAIVAALRQQPAPVDLEQFREAVECLCNGAGSMSSAEWARRDAERKRLLALIDNAGKVGHLPAPVVDDATVERVLDAKVGHLSVRQLFACEREARQGARAILTAAQGEPK